MADVLWQGTDVIEALANHLTNHLTSAPRTDWTAHGVSIDTRTLQQGDIFVALPGEKTDGHEFVAAAFEAGAVAALIRADFACADLSDGLPNDAVLLPVDNVLAALETLGRTARQRSGAQVFAITGSVGKTSVKEALRLALAKSGTVHAAVKSFNNHIGVPLTLARLPTDTDYAVFELGMNHAGEIEALVDMVRPHCAIITEIGAAHIEHFADMTALARAKAEIISGVLPGGTVILPRDNPYFDILAETAKAHKIDIVDFSTGGEASAAACVSRAKLHDTCSCVTAHIAGFEVTYKIGTAGAHHVANSLAVLAAVSRSHADIALAALSLADYESLHEGLAGRGRRWNIGTSEHPVTLIDESYNANPTSMAAALQTLGLVSRRGRGRRIAVLGDMAELGKDAAALHAALAETINTADIDQVMTCGSLMQHLHNVLPPERKGPHVDTIDELVEILQHNLRIHDVVMVKGSNAAGMGRLVDILDAKSRPLSGSEKTKRVG